MPYQNPITDENEKKEFLHKNGLLEVQLTEEMIDKLALGVFSYCGRRWEDAPKYDLLLKFVEEQKGKDYARKVLRVNQEKHPSSHLREFCKEGESEYALDMATVILETIERVGGKEFLLEHLRAVEKESPYPALILAFTVSNFKNSVEPIKLILDYCFKAGGNEFVKELMELKTVGKEDQEGESYSSVLDLFLQKAGQSYNTLSYDVFNLLLETIRRVDDDSSGKKELLRRNCRGTLAKLLEKKKEGESDKNLKQLCVALCDAGIFRSEFRAACSDKSNKKANRLWKIGVGRSFPESVDVHEYRQQQGIILSNAGDGIIKEVEEEQLEIVSEEQKSKIMDDFFSSSSDSSVASLKDGFLRVLNTKKEGCSPAVIDFFIDNMERVHSKETLMYLFAHDHSSDYVQGPTWLTCIIDRKNPNDHRDPNDAAMVLRRFLAFAKRIGGNDFVLDVLRIEGRGYMTDPVTPFELALTGPAASVEGELPPDVMEVIFTALTEACNNDNEKIAIVLQALMQYKGEDPEKFSSLFQLYVSGIGEKSSLEKFQLLVDFIRRVGGTSLLRRFMEGTLMSFLRRKRGESSPSDAMKKLFCCTLADIGFDFFRAEIKDAGKRNGPTGVKGIYKVLDIDNAFMYTAEYIAHKTKRRLQAKATGMTSSKTNNNNGSSNSSSTEGTATIKRDGLKKFFDFFDLEQNGLLDKGAMVAAVTQAFSLCSATEVEKIVRGTEPKSENGGKLDFDQFCLIVEKLI